MSLASNQSARVEEQRESSSSRRRGAIAVLIVTALFFVLDLFASYYLNPFGKNPNTDEYIYTVSANYILSKHVCHPYSYLSMPWQKLCNLEHPPLIKGVMALSISLLGNTLWGARAPSIIFGTLSIPLVAYIGWKITRKESVAIIAAVLFAFDPLLVGLSSIAMLDTGEIFFSLSAFALYLSSAFASHWNLKMAIIGLLFGLSILSKEVAVFALLALVCYIFFETGVISAFRQLALVILGTVATVALGFQLYDQYFTTFPNFVSHIQFLENYASHLKGIYISTNPDVWLTSLSSRDLGSGLGILNPVISFAVFAWFPLLVFFLVSKRRAPRGLLFPAILLFWTYVPYFVIADNFGRDVKYFYSIQMSPALALGAAYLYSFVGSKMRGNNFLIAVNFVAFGIFLGYYLASISHVIVLL